MSNRIRVAPVQLPPQGEVTPWHKCRLVAEILASYLPLLRSLRRDGLSAVLAEVRKPAHSRPATPTIQDRDTAVRLGGITEAVLGPLPTDNRCLIRSVVLLHLLARRGIETELVIGVRTRPGFAAHAWVEHDCVALLPAGDFEPLARL